MSINAPGVCGGCPRAGHDLSYDSRSLLCCDECLSADHAILHHDERLRRHSNAACLNCPHGEDSKVCIDCLRRSP